MASSTPRSQVSPQALCTPFHPSATTISAPLRHYLPRPSSLLPPASITDSAFPFRFRRIMSLSSNPDNSVNWEQLHSAGGRSVLLLSQPRSLHQQLHVLHPASDHDRDTLLTVSYVGNQGHHILVARLRQSRRSRALPQPGWLRSLRRGLDLHQQLRPNCAGNSRRSGTGLRRKYR